MSSDRALSLSSMGTVSPSLRSLAEGYARARAERGVDTENFDVAGARDALDQSALRHDTISQVERTDAGGVTLFHAPGSGPTVLYLHGGGFVGGSITSHGHIALNLRQHLGAPLVFPEYRLAPEHPFPTAFDDVDAALTATSGPIVIAGDSVGGALALHLALNHPERARISALALLAPMLAFDEGSSEYLRTHGRARAMIANSVSPDDRSDPRLTPLAQDLSALPPTLIQMGGADYVKADGMALANAAIAAGAPVTLEHWPNMPHVWHRFAPEAPEAIRALTRAADFLAAHADRETNDPKD